MKLNGLLIFGFLLILESIHAQTDFRPGFVIKQNGDTLKGEIDYRGDILMGKICTFKTNGNESRAYYPTDIIGYRFTDSKYYVSKNIDGNQMFLEFLIDGKVKIYFLRDGNGDHYYIDKEGIGLNEIPYDEEIKYIEGRAESNYYLSKSIYHIGLLNIYLQDAPNFQSRIAAVEKPDRESLIKLTKDYQNIVCKNEACTIYEKKLPAIKLGLEIVGGIVNYPESVNSLNKHNFETGILVHLWMPAANEKLFFKSGILFSSINPDTGKESVYKIPINIEYVYPKGIVKPKLAYGINLYSPFFQSVSLSAGLNIKLYKRVHLGINYEIEFTPTFFFVPKDIFSQTILAGLMIKL